MPLILTEKNPKFGKSVLWSVTEDEDFFHNELKKTSLSMDHISEWHPSRQKEWMSGRYLIHKYIDEDINDLCTDQYGKPVFGESSCHFSISHTAGLVGIMWHTKPVGLDLQIKTDKIQRVAHKFCTKNDYDHLGAYYTKDEVEWVTWGLKEAVYKAYGRGSLSYKNNIILQEVRAKNESQLAEATIEKDDVKIYYKVKIRMIGPYCWCQVYED